MASPTLRIDTSNLEEHGPGSAGDPSVSARLLTPTTRDRSRSISQVVLPALRVSSVGISEKSPVSQNLQNLAVSHGAIKARNESRKLLSHLLGQLQRRPMPPPFLHGLENGPTKVDKGLGAIVRSVKGMGVSSGNLSGGGGSLRKATISEESDDEFGDNIGFHTDVTYDLMNQLKDVLLISVAQSWDVFSEDLDTANQHSKRDSSGKSASFLRRRSMQAAGKRSRSRSASPSRTHAVEAPELLSQCISVLTSVITEDCRFQVSSPRPSKPPNALQAITLDVARFLIHAHSRSPRIVSQIGFAVIHAFETFKSSMHARLLSFFEDTVIGGMLGDLSRLQGHHVLPSLPIEVSFDDDQVRPPMVSILVDEAHEETKPPFTQIEGWRRWSSSTTMEGLRSTNAPEQEVAVYYLSSLVPPLLAAIADHVDISRSSLSTVHRLNHFLSRLIDHKPDAYLDILGVIAYHSPRARNFAISILLTFWPKAVGHVVISRPFQDISYSEILSRSIERGPSISRRASSHDHHYAHQFMPWRFRGASRPLLFEGLALNECGVCFKPIQGFGLHCPLCTCSVHFDCYDYPEGSFFTQYSLASEPEIQKVAVHRFCHVLPFTQDAESATIRKEQHKFRTVNIFSLTLCFICRQPLWGCVEQGLKCNSCRQFIHSSCLLRSSFPDLPRCRSTTVDSSHMVITWQEMRVSFAEHYRELLFTESELSRKNFEEISVFSAVLWTQLQILDNGIALGSIVVEGESDDFELHYLVKLCDALLSSGKLNISPALADYLTENHRSAHECLLCFEWNTLAYIASVIKLPSSSTNHAAGVSSDLLSVGQPNPVDDPSDDLSYPYEVVPLAHLRDKLGDCLNMVSEAAARYFLSHLHHVSLLHKSDSQQTPFENSSKPELLRCTFPLPFGFDASADIETLVAAIEACLSDIDLSNNEISFLLLNRRFWPDGMLSDYTYRRLAKAILSWIFSEDSNLASILRDYVAHGRSLPGVRSGLEAQPWPPQSHSRPSAANSANNGGDYVANRRALLSRYAAPWMLAFHDQDIANYAGVVYDLLEEHAEDPYIDGYFLGVLHRESEARRQAAVSDSIIQLMIKLSPVIFTASDDLFNRWLQRAHVLHSYDESSRSLPRFLKQELEPNHRYSTMVDLRLSISDHSGLQGSDHLRQLMSMVGSSKEGFQRGLHWLCIFVSSEVQLEPPTFMHFASLAGQFQASLEECSMLSKACLWTSWQRSMGRQDLQAVVSALHVHLASELSLGLRSRQSLSAILCFIRQTLATCLLLFGCERKGLIESGMVLTDEIRHLSSRRKLHTRASAVADPIIVDTNLMTSLRLYVDSGVEEVSCLAAKFLNAFVNEAPLVESYEVDNFILRNGFILHACVWQFYDIQVSDVSTARAALLARILVVDSQPFQTLLSQLLGEGHDWELRLQTVLRLFRIILDVTNPAFNVEDRQWRSSVIDIFYHFFSSLWTDDREEIRSSVDTWCQTLLPAHFEAITACFNEALCKAPISERVKLISFLAQLRSHFPTWRVLSWEAINETLLENDFMQKNGDDEDGPAAAHLSMYGLSSNTKGISEADPDLVMLQVSLVSLSLRMISDGITIDITSLLRLKGQVAQLLGFRDVSLVLSSSEHTFYVNFSDLEMISSWAYPCLVDLMLVLDSSHPFELAPSAMGGPYAGDDTTSRLLVGSAFVDVLLDVFIYAEDLPSLPTITFKNVLKTLVIVIYKHDFESRPLRHLQGRLRKAVRRTLDLLLEDTHLSYELRQLALTACQSFIKRWSHIIGNFICEAIEAAAKLLVSLDYEQNPDDVLIIQTRLFLETILTTFSMSGAVNVLFKKRLDSNFFLVLRYVVDSNAKSVKVPTIQTSLRESLLRDTLTRAAENDIESHQLVIENLNSYVNIVYNSHYSPELMQFVGMCLTNIARKTADWPPDASDPSALIMLACTLIQNNKAQSRDLLMYTDTLLRAALLRFHISAASITRVFQVTFALYKKTESPEQSLASNRVVMAVLEILTDGLNGKARVSSLTLFSLVESITSDPVKEIFRLPLENAAKLADAGLFYLYSESIESSSQSDFRASLTVAKLILEVAETLPQVLTKLKKSLMAVRVWNLILLAALSSHSDAPAVILFDYFHAFCLAYYRSLNAHQQHADFGSQEVAHVDISRAYASIKLWLLLSRKAAVHRQADIGHDNLVRDDKENILSRMVWNELWPPFEHVVVAIETDAQVGNLSALASTVMSSVADLFLFLRQSRCVIALEVSSQIVLLNRLRGFGRADSKISRVLRNLTDIPPNVPLEFFVTQTTAEIWAEEKLEAAKRQELSKAFPERSRRIVT